MIKTLIPLAVCVAMAGSALAQQPASQSTQASVQAAKPNPAEFDKQLAQAQEQMRQMQAQMDKLRVTKDPQERQALLQQHWASMQATMEAMHAMWGPGGGMGCCMATGPGMMMDGQMMQWGHMRGYYSNLTPDQLRQRQYMMDRYLPMQQMMMDHMMWHQQWMSQGSPAK